MISKLNEFKTAKYSDNEIKVLYLIDLVKEYYGTNGRNKKLVKSHIKSALNRIILDKNRQNKIIKLAEKDWYRTTDYLKEKIENIVNGV